MDAGSEGTVTSQAPATFRRPVRVLILENEFNLGGSEKKLFDFIEHADSRRVQVSVCCLKEGGYFRAPLVERGVPFDEKLMDGPFDLRAFARFARVLRQRRPDVVYTMAHPNSVILAAWARARGLVPRFVVSFHAMGSPDGGRLVARWLRPVIRRADRLLAVANMHREYLTRVEKLDAAQIEVIHNGVDTALYHPPHAEERARAREVLGFGDDDVVFIEVASLKPAKRQTALLRAAADVMHRHESVHLAFAGSGPSRDECVALAGELGIADRTHFLGIQRDVAFVLHASDVLVLPSCRGTETFPNVVLEAMASGLPVIVTDVGSVREMVEPDETALLIPVDDTIALQSALERIAADVEMRRQMGARGRALVCERFPLELMCREREDLLEHLAAEGKDGS